MRFYLVLISCIVVFAMGCKHEHELPHELPTYAVSLPEMKDTVLNKEYIAQIKAFQHVELRALDKGYLAKIFVDEGQRVNKGQLLFQLMPNVYQAEKKKAQAERNKAAIEFQNTKILADSNIVSKNELALAKVNLERAEAELDLADLHLKFTEIRAPFDGIVGRFNDVRLGSLVEEGELLTTLSDNSKMWVYFNVPEADYLNLSQNQEGINNYKLPVQLELADGHFLQQSGEVETIESDFNNETGNIAFRATFLNPKALLRHGQTGKIYLPFKLKKALLIPQLATFEVLDKKYVYVLEEGKVNARQILVSKEIPHLYQVAKGLERKDTFLLEGLRKVQVGDKILPKLKHQAEVVREIKEIKSE